MRRQAEEERRKMATTVQQGQGQLPKKFVTKVIQLPVVKFGFTQAQGLYSKVKELNIITHKSFELAESVGGVFVGVAEKGLTYIPYRGPLDKIDDLAAQGVTIMEQKVPSLQKDPQVVVSELVGGAKERVGQASDKVLSSRPVQTYFDLLSFVLSKAQVTLDKVLPPGENEDKNAANGEIGTGPSGGVERGWALLAEFFCLVYTAKDRVLVRLQSRMESTSNMAEKVLKEAKKVVPAVHGLHSNVEQVNGDHDAGDRENESSSDNQQDNSNNQHQGKGKKHHHKNKQ